MMFSGTNISEIVKIGFTLRKYGFRMKSKESGFTLIELLMVIAIVGILAAVAMPTYRGYTINAKLTEVMNAMATVATGVTAYHYDQNTWPDCPTAVDIRNSLGVSLANITRVSNLSVSRADGAISADVQNINLMVDGKSLTLTPSTATNDASILWTWGWSPDFPPQFRPKSGR